VLEAQTRYEMSRQRVGIGTLIVVPWLAIAGVTLMVCCLCLQCSSIHALLGGVFLISAAVMAGTALRLLDTSANEKAVCH
jgi:hypothetical protein